MITKKSSIQIKRGNKSKLPLLKDGQMAWCKDTKELFIGSDNKNELINKPLPEGGGDSNSGTVTAEYLKLSAPNGREFKVCVSNTGELEVSRFVPTIGDVEYKGLIINQIYGGGVVEDNGTAISHGFIELYNNSSETIRLDGLSVQYCLMGNDWKVCALNGVIKPSHSYLIRANRHSEDQFVKHTIKECDKDWPITMFNKGIKVIVLKGIEALEVINPFNSNNGKPVDGYIDMIGCGDSFIDGSEGIPIYGQSKQKSVRRLDGFIDTHDNEMDCQIVDYRTADINHVRPRYSGDGAWNETGSINPDERLLDYLKINQVYGGGSDAACSHHFVELYNTHQVKDISLRGISLFGATYKAPNWQHVALEGMIPPRTSFLIRCNASTGAYKVAIENSDLDAVLRLDKAMKVFLIETVNATALTGIPNPHNIDGAWKKCEGYIDGFGCHGNSGLMLDGSKTDTIDGFETEAPGGGDPGTNFVGCGGNSKQTAMRRKAGFIDTDTNSEDFEALRYANYGIDETLTDKQPRWIEYGPWEPGDKFGQPETTKVYNISHMFGSDPKTTRTFKWFTESSLITGFEYGVYGQSLNAAITNVVVDGAENINTVKLVDLTPGTSYSYRIGSGEEWTKIATFKTESNNNETVEFIHVTDPQGANKADFDKLANVLSEAVTEGVTSFVSNTGDHIEDKADEKNRWKMYFDSIKVATMNTPFMSTPGNNDVYLNKLDLYNTFFANDNLCPSNNAAYHFEYGNTFFLSLDYNRTIEEQKIWADKVLKATDKKWKVVLIHGAPYTSIKEPTFTLAQTFEENNVDLVLCGHKHMYMRSHKMKNDQISEDGPMYIMGNGSGSKHGDLDPAQPWMDVALAPKLPTYNKINITNESITLSCYTVDGKNKTKIDTVTLTKDGVIEPPVTDDGDFIITSNGDTLKTSSDDSIVWN